jgi:hypothetical protein
MTLANGTLANSTSLSGYACFTVDSGNPNVEFICGTASGTSITSLIRGIDTLDGKTSVASLIFSHRRGADVKITDFPVFSIVRNIVNGTDTFPNPITYGVGVNPVGSQDLTTKAYVLSVVNGGTVSVNEVVVAGTAGETFSTGQPVYLKASDSRWYKLLANDSQLASSQNIAIGIALSSGSAGVAIGSGVATHGIVSGLLGLTANNLYYISDTGTFSTTPGTYTVSVGWALSTTTILFSPKNVNIPTPAQNAAMGTISVAPSGSNKFLTQNELGLTSGLSIPCGESFTGATTPQPAVIVNDLFQPRVDDIDFNSGADATTMGRSSTSGQKKALRIIPRTTVTASTINIMISKNGSPADNAQIEIDTDSAGFPSGTPIANGTSNGVAGSGLSASVSNQQAFTFASPFTLTAGTTYWVVIERSSTLSDSNYYNIGGALAATNGGSSSGANADYASFKGATMIGASWGQDGTYNLLPYVEIIPTTGSSLSLWQSTANAASDVFKSFQGFVTTTASAGGACTIYTTSTVPGFSSLIPGVDYYLSTSKGVLQANGTNVGQYVGTATSATAINIPYTKLGAPIGYGSANVSGVTKAPFNGTILVAGPSGTTTPLSTIVTADQSNMTTNAYTFKTATGSTSLTASSLSVPVRKGQYFEVTSLGTSASVILIPQF